MARITTRAIVEAVLAAYPMITDLTLEQEDGVYVFSAEQGEETVEATKLSDLTIEQWVAAAASLAIDLDDEEDLPNSVVASTYKAKYKERAATMRKPKDVSVKALARSTSDWLAIELARRTLDEKTKLIVPAFEAILDANGVKHSHWNRTTKGWQGRLRMTGRLALQRVVAEAGELALPDASTIPAPKSWIAKHQH
jgi:hypothetical protein